MHQPVRRCGSCRYLQVTQPVFALGWHTRTTPVASLFRSILQTPRTPPALASRLHAVVEFCQWRSASSQTSAALSGVLPRLINRQPGIYRTLERQRPVIPQRHAMLPHIIRLAEPVPVGLPRVIGQVSDATKRGQLIGPLRPFEDDTRLLNGSKDVCHALPFLTHTYIP